MYTIIGCLGLKTGGAGFSSSLWMWIWVLVTTSPPQHFSSFLTGILTFLITGTLLIIGVGMATYLTVSTLLITGL